MKLRTYSELTSIRSAWLKGMYAGSFARLHQYSAHDDSLDRLMDTCITAFDGLFLSNQLLEGLPSVPLWLCEEIASQNRGVLNHVVKACELQNK